MLCDEVVNHFDIVGLCFLNLPWLLQNYRFGIF